MVGLLAEPWRNKAAIRNAIAPAATPIPIVICWTMLAKVVAALIWPGGTSAKPSVFRLVNCIDRQSPPKKRIAAMTGAGIAGDNKAQANNESAVKSPLPIRTLRNPKCRMTGVVTVFIPRLPAKTASTSSPDLNALSAKPIWKSKGKRNGITLIATRKREPPQIVTANVGIRRDERLIRGVACRPECQTIRQPVKRLTVRIRRIANQGVGCCPTSSSPYISVEQAIADETNPVQSNGRFWSSRLFPIQRTERTMPTNPSGTLRKKIQRQDA